jgi:hypothetical protein
MAQSCSPCWLAHPPKPQRQRTTHVMAIFSDQWNWSFSPNNIRSRRRRFINSGETISGFTAVFCDDWKDSTNEEEEIDDYIWSPKRGRDGDVGILAQHRDSSKSPPRDKRQHLESPVGSPIFSAITPESPPFPSTTPFPEAYSFTATSFEPQSCQFDQFGVSEKSPSPGHSEWNVTPNSVDDNEEVFLMPDFALSENPFPNLTTSLKPDITAVQEMDRDTGLTLVSEEAENCLAARTNLNFGAKTSNGILDSCEEVLCEQWSNNDDCEVETSGFEFWNDFMKCFMGVDGNDEIEKTINWNFKGAEIRATL